MPRVRLLVAYEGTDFHGWQAQTPPDAAPLRTVQGVLQGALEQVLRQPIVVVGASRTDSGVHAAGQVAAFTAEFSMPVEKIPLAVTSRLPPDAQVRAATVVPDDFDPIADAISKSYRYRIASAEPPQRFPPLFDRRHCWWTRSRLDLGRMRTAAAQLVGEHDLAGFAHTHHGRTTTVRTIHCCEVSETRPGRIQIDVAGSGFLYHTVRIIAGTLLEIGRGRMPGERIGEILALRDRRLAGPTLGPEGLCLRWIRYPGDPPPIDAEDLPE
jgi:tRNA pseudouridine38-40 synthase